MNILELFAGSRSFSKAAEKLGHKTFTVDWEGYDKIDLQIDIKDLKIEDIPFVPDIVWASPDCTTYTIAAISTHRNKTEPKTQYAKECDITNQHFISLIKQWLEINPDMVFFIENPRGMLRHMPFMKDFKRHTVWYCLGGETKIITLYGSKKIETLSGTTQTLLMKDGTWKDAPIRCYGKQKLYKLTVRRAGSEHIIYATGNHKWIIRLSNKREVIVDTVDLKKKDTIPTIYSNQQYDSLDNEGIMRGFVFGDGYVNYRKGKDGKKIPYDSVAQFCGKKDEELINLFEDLGRSRRYNKGYLNIHGLPFEWKKEIPDIDTYSYNYIAGWLSGYFAADGTVGKNGQVIMCSSKKEHMEKFKDLCQYVGIGTYFINKWMRKGFGKYETPIYMLGIIRSTVPDWFYLMSHHKDNNFKPKFEPHWNVVSVEESDRYENVYCADVDDYESFVLDGNILTHNCQYGDDRAKPTDIWTNSTKWVPRPECHNFKYDKEGNIIDRHCHHHSARRGAKTGTQGRKGSYERSQIPEELCLEVLNTLTQ